MLRSNGRWLLLTVLLAVLAVAAGVEYEHRAVRAWNPANLVRLHVIAHSDAARDQEAKLAVRDAILRRYAGQAQVAPAAAVDAIREDVDRLRDLAGEVLGERGLGYGARAEWGVFSFPRRTYAGRVVPGGDYRAVRVTLGAGQGDNWWCVLFPPLCFLELAAGDPSPEALIRQVEAGPVEVRLWFGERAGEIARRWPTLGRWLQRHPVGLGSRD